MNDLRPHLQVLLVLFAVLVCSLRSQQILATESNISRADASELVSKAQLAYSASQYDEAVATYEEIVDLGLTNGHVYYNLGDAYFRAGRTGEAVAAFVAARALLPRDADVAANLQFALSKTQDNLTSNLPAPALPGGDLLRVFTLKEWSIVAIAMLLISTSLSLGHLVWRRKKSFFLPAVVSTLGSCFFLSIVWLKALHQEEWGAVVANEAPVRTGPDEGSAVLFTIHAGAPFKKIGDKAGGYQRIELSDGKTGWILGTHLRIFPQGVWEM